ncbi:hypothetical protein RHSIM_Rhsim08G0130100 [Rhododendron simsii]|uniref:RING-type E3 ubiquitin transferase n=1 Tax=Rhododendron simsii TaxID=118357 RepID=A0A834LJG9_RHOSS|nr:hypothetical protein RHSIM_Rhsim08G0130100 [Rhododendron simsii]
MMMFRSSIMMGERSGGFDRYRDWRLNVDNMSYEELLELGDRIGYVNTGLKEDMIVQCLRKTKLSDNLFSPLPTEMERKCSICQEDYEGNDEVGKLECGHFYHIYCIKQWLMQKMNGKSSSLNFHVDRELKLHYSKYARGSTQKLEHTDFNYAMAIIKDTSTEAHDWLMGLPIQMWVGNLRGKPVLTFIDNIRRVVSHVVNLRVETCYCKVWEISGLPYKHAASCISHKRMNIEEFCHTHYHRDTYLRAHGEIIHPLHDETMWEEVPGELVQPPPLKRLSSRPRKSRRRAADELAPGGSESRRSCTVRCANCKEIGHNKRTCQRAPVRGSRRGNGSTMRGRGRSQDADVGDPTGASIRDRGIVVRGRGRDTSASTRGRGTFAGTRGRGKNAKTSGSGTNAETSGIGTYAAVINSHSTGPGLVGEEHWVVQMAAIRPSLLKKGGPTLDAGDSALLQTQFRRSFVTINGALKLGHLSSELPEGKLAGGGDSRRKMQQGGNFAVRIRFREMDDNVQENEKNVVIDICDDSSNDDGNDEKRLDELTEEEVYQMTFDIHEDGEIFYNAYAKVNGLVFETIICTIFKRELCRLLTSQEISRVCKPSSMAVTLEDG